MKSRKTLDCHYEIFNPNIVSADGCYVTDDTGMRYIDFESGVWCTSIGHNNKRVSNAIIGQLSTISHTGYRYTTKVVNEAAEKVLGIVGFDDGKCVFLSSGSEAVEFGVRVAREVVDKPYLLRLDNYYLSAYGISASKSSEQWISLDLSTYCGDVDAFLSGMDFAKIGAFVFEPGNASGTAKLPPIELIKSIEARIKANGALIVVDEVTTGIGRTGRWCGFEHYDMRPDIVSFGKGIGNGYPVSVVCLARHVVDKVDALGFRYAQSHQDDPLACAVAKEVLTVIEENNYIQRAAHMGTILEGELQTLKEKHKCIKEVRGTGLMYAMEFFADANTDLEKIHRELFDSGYIVGLHKLANLLRFYPPLTIENAHIKNMANTLDIILTKVG